MDDIETRDKSDIRFKESLIQEIIKLQATDSKIRLSGDGLQCFCEIVRLFTLEAVWRTGNQASNEGFMTVNIDHLEKILPQLMLDFA